MFEPCVRILGVQSICTNLSALMTLRHKNQELEVIADDWRRNETLEETG